MPHEVIMPALGMAQDSGVLIGWLKAAGDPVKAGDPLMEVETDKATMEVEAAHDGFLTDLSAEAGATVPVGQVVAMISDTPEGSGKPGAPTEAAVAPKEDSKPDAMPEGRKIIMPALGMAQDSALIVGWSKAPGDAVSADDTLLEVETDKSTMEVPAGHDGYVAALLAAEGEDVPVGEVIAIISAERPDAPVRRSRAEASQGRPEATESLPEKAAPAIAAQSGPAPKTTPAPRTAGAQPEPRTRSAAEGGRVLASPKARRLAAEEGLDLQRLVDAGATQPFHVRDLETLRQLPAPQPAPAAATSHAAQHLTADVAAEALDAFLDWLAKESAPATPRAATLAAFAAAAWADAMGEPGAVQVEAPPAAAVQYAPAQGQPIADLAQTDAPAILVLRDLVATPLRAMQLGAEATPVLSLTRAGDRVHVTLEGQMPPPVAIALLSGFAARLADPLRHLL